ncbi:hypothetical protein [Actinophytocola sp.]|uniref:hypothetical protein n=1 Tax=Actinophytocola sp. TaxID=1872138 RepID=UPI002ED5EBE6
MRRALALLTAVVALLATACASGTEGTPVATKQAKTTKTSSAPFDGERLRDGEVVQVDKLDGIRLDSPDDGRLRSYGVAVDVVDFGTGDVVEADIDSEYGAGEDSTLLAFRLRVTPFTDEDLSDKVKATVSVDGRQRSLPGFEYTVNDQNEDQTLSYLVAVPDDRREVELELKYADLAQQFDLLEGERVGEQPAILYRSADAPSVYVENLTPQKIDVTNEDGEVGTYVVGVTRAELTYFAPRLADVPGDTDKAWLIVTYEPTGEGVLESNPSATHCVVPFADFNLADDKGGAYPVVDKHSTMKEYASEQTLVFEVPATLSDATFTLKSAGFRCADGGVTASGTATVEMTLPED